MADDLPNEKPASTIEAAPPPVVKSETVADEAPKITEAKVPEPAEEKAATSPAKTPAAAVEPSIDTPPLVPEEKPAAAVPTETPPAPAAVTPTSETVVASPAEGSPTKTGKDDEKTGETVEKEASKPIETAQVVVEADVAKPGVVAPTTTDKPSEVPAPEKSEELPESEKEAPKVSSESTPTLAAEKTPESPAVVPAEIPTDKAPEPVVEKSSESAVAKTEDSSPPKPVEAPAASSPAKVPQVAQPDVGADAKDADSAKEAPAAQVEAEIKPSADDSGIQESDSKIIEAPVENVRQEGEQDAGVQEAASAHVDEAQAENVVDGAVVERQGDEEEQWSEEDEGNASYGEEHEASPPKKSETVSDEEANLDFDEDKSNPQYIPKKGAFYEHDDRRGTDDEDEASEEEANKDKEAEQSEVAGGSKDSPEHRRAQRVLQSETKDRWDHDMFDANEQGPKSSDELVQQYGYDIRDESSAPRAAGRRRYGRGPNKYTRDWQDEKAYHGKTHNAQERRDREFNPRKDDFPCLPSAQRPRDQQNLKESQKDQQHQVREERPEHPPSRDNRRQSDRGERPERSDRPESKDPRRSDPVRDNNRKDRRDLRNKLDSGRQENPRFDSRKPQRNEGWGGGDHGGHRDHGHRDNGGGRPRGGADHRDFRDNGHRENFHRENSHRENWRDNRDGYRDNNRDAGRNDNREPGRDARDAARGDARDGGRDNRDGGREIIMRQDRKIGSGRTQEPRNSRKSTEVRNGEYADQRRPVSDDKRPHLPQQNGSTVESKRYTQQRAAARGDASQAAVSPTQSQPNAAQAQPQQAKHHAAPPPPRQAHPSQQPMPPQHVPQQQAYYELPPGPAPYFVPQFDGAAGPPQNFIQPNPFMNHTAAYIAPTAPAAHPYMMAPEGPVPDVYAPAPGANGAPGGITYYSATQQMYMAHQPQQSQPRRKAAIPIKPPPEAKHQQVEPKPLET